MNNEILLSIIIPVYNVENYIEQCICSFCESNVKNIEIILIDDGSKDNSFEICKVFSEKDNRIKLYHITNSGASEARNYGIEKAIGKYIFFCDSDDYINKVSLEEVLEILKDNEPDLFVFSKCNEGIDSKSYFEDKLETNKGYTNDLEELYKYTYKIRISAPWKKVFKRDIISKYDIRFEREQILHEDLKFLLVYLRYTNSVYFIDINMYNHRYTENSLSKKTDVKMFFDIYTTYSEMKKLLKDKKINMNFINLAKRRYLEIVMGIIARMKIDGYKNNYIMEYIKKSGIDSILDKVKVATIKEFIQLIIFKFRLFDVYMLIYKNKKGKK